MKHRPFSELAEQLSKHVAERWDKLVRKPCTNKEFSTLTNRLTVDIDSHLNSRNTSISDIKEHKGDWTATFNEIRKNYSLLHRLLEDYQNQEKVIHRVETRAQRRALFYRILNTLFIGFGVMLVYYVAQKLNILMPLMRVPL